MYRFRGLLVVVVFLLIAASVQANQQKMVPSSMLLVDEGGQINLGNASNLGRTLNNMCQTQPSPQYRNSCQNSCSQLYNRLNDFSTTIGRPNVTSQLAVRSLKAYSDRVISCARLFPRNRVPNEVIEHLKILEWVKQGGQPKPASSTPAPRFTGPNPGGNNPFFGPRSPANPPANKPRGGSSSGGKSKAVKFLTPKMHLSDFMKYSVLMNRCAFYSSGPTRTACQQACRPVNVAAVEVNNSVARGESQAQFSAKVDAVFRTLPACEKKLPRTDEFLVSLKSMLTDFKKDPGQFARYEGLKKADISPKNDAKPKIYGELLVQYANETLDYCTGKGAKVGRQYCTNPCNVTLDKAKAIKAQIDSGTLKVGPRSDLNFFKQQVASCRKNYNYSPRLKAMEELANYLDTRPDLFQETIAAEKGKGVNSGKTKSGYVSFTPPDGSKPYVLPVNYTPTELSPAAAQYIGKAGDLPRNSAGKVDHSQIKLSLANYAFSGCNGTDKRRCQQACSGITALNNVIDKNNTTRDQLKTESVFSSKGARGRRAPKGTSTTFGAFSPVGARSNIASCLNYHASAGTPINELGYLPAAYDYLVSGDYLADLDYAPIATLRHELDELQAQCYADGNVDCMMACTNAITTSGRVMRGGMHIAALEKVFDGYVKACQAGAKPGQILKYTNEFVRRDLKGELDKERVKKTLAKLEAQSAPNEREKYAAKYGPVKGAPFKSYDLTRTTDAFRHDLETLFDALLTVSNYCGDTKGLACPAGMNNEIMAGLTVAYSRPEMNKVALEQLKRALYAMGRSDLPHEDKKLEKRSNIYRSYKAIPESLRPYKFAVIEDFVEDAIALQPSTGVFGGRRSYCYSGSSSPFVGMSDCEYLSALYYRDFERLVLLERIWTEQPMLIGQEVSMGYSSEALSNLFGSYFQMMRDNSELLSPMPIITMSYLMDYQSAYPSCMSSDAATYTHTTTRVSEFRNRWGYTLQSTRSTSSESYRVNPVWTPYVEKLGINLTSDAVGVYNLLDTYFVSDRVREQIEAKYGAETPTMEGIGGGLYQLMSRFSCDSEVMETIDLRLREFLDFRWGMGAV